MRAVTARRSQADIADDIVFELRPLRRLKRDEVRPEPAIAISQHIETINKIVAAWARIGAVGVIRKRAARAVRALAALEKVCPILDVRLALERIELLMHKDIEVPDPRGKLHWMCAHSAITTNVARGNAAREASADCTLTRSRSPITTKEGAFTRANWREKSNPLRLPSIRKSERRTHISRSTSMPKGGGNRAGAFFAYI